MVSIVWKSKRKHVCLWLYTWKYMRGKIRSRENTEKEKWRGKSHFYMQHKERGRKGSNLHAIHENFCNTILQVPVIVCWNNTSFLFVCFFCLFFLFLVSLKQILLIVLIECTLHMMRVELTPQ